MRLEYAIIRWIEDLFTITSLIFSMLLHASSVAFDHKAVLLTGPTGVGKSDLALRLILEEGATLISDDQTKFEVVEGELRASPPETLAGLIEVRHVGILKMPYRAGVPVAFLLELVPLSEPIARLPEETSTLSLLDIKVRKLILPAFAASTPAKIKAALCFENTLQ